MGIELDDIIICGINNNDLCFYVVCSSLAQAEES
jgi:hypothetical protein